MERRRREREGEICLVVKYLLKTVAGGGVLAAGFTEWGRLWRPLALSEPTCCRGQSGEGREGGI